MVLNTENAPPRQHALLAREFAVGTAATLTLFLSVLFVPMAGLFMGIFAPLPTLLSFYRWGSPLGYCIPGGAILVGGVLLTYLNSVQSMPYLIELLLLGVFLGMGMRRQWSLEKTIGTASLLVFALGAFIFWQFHRPADGGVFGSLEEELRQTITMVLRNYGGNSTEMRFLEDSIQQMAPLMARLLPGAALASALVTSWLNLLMVKRYSQVHRMPLPPWGDWPRWKASDFLVWVVIGCGFSLLLPFHALKIVALNVLIILGAVYLFQGLAVVAFYFEKWKLPRILRAILYGFLLLQQFASLGAVLVGFFDTWFDFRRLSKKPASTS